MLKSEKLEAGPSWSLRGLTARTIRDDSKPKWWSWFLFFTALMTVVPFYYLGGWLMFSHAGHRKRLVENQRHRELVEANKK